MKKQVQNFIRSLGGTSAYAGNTDHGNVKTLFIVSAGQDTKIHLKNLIKTKFWIELPFTIK